MECTLSVTQQAQIEAACGDNFRHAIAEGEGIQGPALKTLQEKGVTLAYLVSRNAWLFSQKGWDEVASGTC